MITETTNLNYDEMQKIAKTHVCSCGCLLSVAWLNGQYALRCAKDLNHNAIKQKDRIPEYLRSEVYKGMTTQLTKIDEARMTIRVNQAKFPQQLKPEEKQLLIRVALDYGLDPLMGELTIYQGKPFISIDGRLRKAHETGEFEGIESRPATKEERDARTTQAESKLWRSEVFKKGCTHGFVGWGEVKPGELKGNEYLPTVAWPDRMAEKRSQVMALRLAFYLPLPSFEDIGNVESTIEPAKPAIEVIEGQIVQKEQPKSNGKFDPEGKTGADLFNYALDHGYTMDKIKTILQVEGPKDIKNVKVAASVLFGN